MLNEVYERGDITCVADTLSQLTGLDIDYAASIKWGGVIEVTDAIGGVDVCVGGEGIYDLENTGLALEPGTHNLKGQEALEFLRTRYGVGGSDLNRIGNQQVYMSALVRKLTSEEVLTNPGTLLTLARTVLANVQPTSTLTDPVVLARVALAARDVPLSDYAFVPYPVLDDPTAPNRVVPESYRAAALFEAIRANEPLDLRGPGGGAVLAEEGDDTSPEEEEPPAEEPSEEPEPEEPSADVDFLGSHADQPTCSDGAGQR
jgi:LCP family protein required for cell wall assembly